MAITDKTRKTLWAKSGNRCLLCRIELVQEIDDNSNNLIIGQECHIISEKENGPRYNSDFKGDHDSYDNLALLCANDHKRIDELTEVYTVDKLKSFKTVHENWVRTALQHDATAFANDQLNIKSLPKVVSGQQIVDIIIGTHMFDFNHDELKTESEVHEIGGLFDELKDIGDVISDFTYADRAKYALHLSERIKQIEALDFFLFGLSRKLRYFNDKMKDMGLFETASLVAVRQNNPGIVSDFLIAKFPTKTSINF